MKPTPQNHIHLIVPMLSCSALGFLMFGCQMAHGQTNPTFPNNIIFTPMPASQPVPDSTAADWSKALGDLGFHVSAATMSLIILIGLPFVRTMAVYLRKAISKSAQVNKAGILLAHVAGVDNPTLAGLAAEIPPAKPIPAVK